MVVMGLWGATAVASPDRQLSYSTRLIDGSGAPIEGARDVIFRIFDAPTSGTELWAETRNGTSFEDGRANVLLGAVTPIPQSAFTGGTWLEVSVDGTVLGGRTALLPTAYAHTGLGLAPLSAPPVTCSSVEVGRIYFDTADDEIRVCDGTDWITAGNAPLGSSTNPAVSCLEIHQDQPSAPSGAYSIDLGPGGVQLLYCDMTSGNAGWTLIGEVAGKFDMYDRWLRATENVANLQHPTIQGSTWASVNAVSLAVNHATHVRIADQDAALWASWPMPVGRTTSTWWNHAAGQSTINAATDTSVLVTAHTGATATCYQSVYGIMPLNVHGGSYPAATMNTAGNTTGGDWCLAVGVLNGTANGFSQNGNGFDAPADGNFPNPSLNLTPRVTVWVR